jgi:hypothetical protein
MAEKPAARIAAQDSLGSLDKKVAHVGSAPPANAEPDVLFWPLDHHLIICYSFGDHLDRR